MFLLDPHRGVLGLFSIGKLLKTDEHLLNKFTVVVANSSESYIEFVFSADLIHLYIS